jgi:hypothetical protein
MAQAMAVRETASQHHSITAHLSTSHSRAGKVREGEGDVVDNAVDGIG